MKTQNLNPYSYAEECTLRKEYEEKLRASGNLIEKHNDNSKQEAEAKIMSQNISNVYLLPTLTGFFLFSIFFLNTFFLKKSDRKKKKKLCQNI